MSMTGDITFHYHTPDRIPEDILTRVQELIDRGEAVGPSYIRENLRDAFLIAYALDKEMRVVGTVTHKYPKEVYRRRIEEATGLSLSGYLERGYTSVEPAYRKRNIADILIKGLIARSKGQRIYTTIRMDNLPALRLTRKNRMTLAATFINPRTGNKIGVFVNSLEQTIPPTLL
jgi:GNAT superfamily N-acetyltransferase